MEHLSERVNALDDACRLTLRAYDEMCIERGAHSRCDHAPIRGAIRARELAMDAVRHLDKFIRTVDRQRLGQ